MTCLSSNHIILYSNINRLFTLSIMGASKKTEPEWLMENLTNYFLLCFKLGGQFSTGHYERKKKKSQNSLVCSGGILPERHSKP